MKSSLDQLLLYFLFLENSHFVLHYLYANTKRKPETELVYYEHDREDDEAICRECSQKKDREIEQSVVDVDIWNFEK